MPDRDDHLIQTGWALNRLLNERYNNSGAFGSRPAKYYA